MTLHELIRDCGGPTAVARVLECTPQNIHKMIKRGYLPDCDRREKKRAEALAPLQQRGTLTPEQIRAIGV